MPLGESVYDYFKREVKPHVPDARIDEEKRDPLEVIDADLKACADRIKRMIE